ncbi:MAG: class II fumarate hydratase, partial [Pseudomonadota bacterium]
MGNDSFRIERDSMGELQVPADALWGAQTQRAVQNFPISGRPLPRAFIRAVALVKACAAHANMSLGLLSAPVADAIVGASMDVADGKHDAQFPVDVFQTGSGTSTNMNANEVIAALASVRLADTSPGRAVHPNDEVNMSQSSNDVIPTAIHVSAALLWRDQLRPALQHLAATLRTKEAEVGAIVKTGRTHLMDAMPVTLGQELGAWRTQVEKGIERIAGVEPRLLQLAQGGTAVGTGINAHPDFSARFCLELSRATGLAFRPNSNLFEALATQDTAVELSGQLKTLAVSLMKIANDLRWMNSGPLAGL